MTYLVYKFTVKPTGDFYIGITVDLDRRMTSHFNAIKSFVKKLILMPASERISCIGYALAAKNFVKGRRSLGNTDCFKQSMCSIEVIRTCYTKWSASIVETEYLQRHKDDFKCFNTEKISRYYTKKKDKS